MPSAEGTGTPALLDPERQPTDGYYNGLYISTGCRGVPRGARAGRPPQPHLIGAVRTPARTPSTTDVLERAWAAGRTAAPDPSIWQGGENVSNDF